MVVALMPNFRTSSLKLGFKQWEGVCLHTWTFLNPEDYPLTLKEHAHINCSYISKALLLLRKEPRKSDNQLKGEWLKKEHICLNLLLIWALLGQISWLFSFLCQQYLLVFINHLYLLRHLIPKTLVSVSSLSAIGKGPLLFLL
jgi:hypothetical protein